MDVGTKNFHQPRGHCFGWDLYGDVRQDLGNPLDRENSAIFASKISSEGSSRSSYSSASTHISTL